MTVRGATVKLEHGHPSSHGQHIKREKDCNALFSAVQNIQGRLAKVNKNTAPPVPATGRVTIKSEWRKYQLSCHGELRPQPLPAQMYSSSAPANLSILECNQAKNATSSNMLAWLSQHFCLAYETCVQQQFNAIFTRCCNCNLQTTHC
jgi:hypothetical protein